MRLYDIFLKHPLICTDSRNCPPDSIFFALKGDNFNANGFAAGALEKGCAYAVIDNPQYAVDERFIVVNDVLESLQELARFHRQKLGTKIIGITGTNGKTTTKELIASVLMEKFNTHFTRGNFNNHIGVPLTLLQLKPEHDIAVVEMGANHPGEIKMLAEIALPDYGIITNVGKAHLEGFGSFEGVMNTKAELYDFILKKSGKIFLNTGNEYLKKMAEKSGFRDANSILAYKTDSEINGNQATGTITSCSPLLRMQCVTSEGDFDVKTQLIGTYNAENVLAAVAIGNYLGVSNDQIKVGLENYQPRNNRSQFTETDKNKLIIDAYNANPTSLQAAILNFAHIEVSDKTLIIGDMLELGSQSAEEHQKVVDLVNESGFTDVFLVGPNFNATRNKFSNFADVDLLKEYLQKNPLLNHFILIKGSHGIHLEKVISEL